MEDDKEKLLEEWAIVEVLVKENPCGMPSELIGSLKHVIKGFIGKQCLECASRDQVAIYLQRDVRTLTRWQSLYDDFPQPRHNGHREVCYNWVEIVRWKLNHPEIYKQ